MFLAGNSRRGLDGGDEVTRVLVSQSVYVVLELTDDRGRFGPLGSDLVRIRSGHLAFPS